jgi:LacI family transcriptional regulator
MDVPQRRSRSRTAGAETGPAGNSQPPAKRATIHDVAKVANVSPATVSLVFNEKGQVSKPTRDRVIEAIDSVGYQPRRAEGRPRRRRQSMYCFVVDDIRNPYFN